MQKLINVNGINYDVTTVTGTYSQHKSRIINSPWYINAWTDEKMERDREELAKKVAEKFGTPPNARNVYVYLFEDEEGEGKTGGPFFVTRPGSGGAFDEGMQGWHVWVRVVDNMGVASWMLLENASPKHATPVVTLTL